MVAVDSTSRVQFSHALSHSRLAQVNRAIRLGDADVGIGLKHCTNSVVEMIQLRNLP